MSLKKRLPPWLALLFLLLLCLLLTISLLTRSQHDEIGQIIEQQQQQADDDTWSQEEPLPTEPAELRLDSGLALIIDDIGYDMPALRRILALPVPVAISIIPDAPFAAESAELAHAMGQMVMLHLPMEPSSEKYRERMTPYFLHEGMSRVELRDTFLRGLERVPYVEGVNNHMGSYLSQKPEPMRWVMELCRERNLFFVDSKTSSRSVAADIAESMHVAWASRQIFLDHFLEQEKMQQAWEKAERCLAKGYRCVVIGHPHKETVAFLEAQLSNSEETLLTPIARLLQGGNTLQQAKIAAEGLL